MFCFFDNPTIPQPANWPNGTPWNANQHQIASVFYDYAQFGGADRAAFNGTPILVTIDETGLANQRVCSDFFNRQATRDIFGLQKYYYDSAQSAVFQRNGWVPNPATYTPAPATDIQVTFAQSTERTAFDTNLATMLTNLNGLITNTSSTIAQLNSDKQELARIVDRLVRMFHRIFAPDS